MQGDQHREALGGVAPLGIRIALEHAKTGAGHVQQHAIGALLEALDGLAAGDDTGLHVVGTGAAGALLEVLQLPLFHVHRQQAALAFHHGGDVQCLATGTRAGVDDPHARGHFQGGGDQLGAGILLLEAAIGKGLGAEQGGVRGDLQGSLHTVNRNGGDMLFGQNGLQLFPGALEGVDPQVALGHPGQGGTLGRPGLSQLLAAQLLQPARATIHQHRVLFGLGQTATECLFIEAIQGRVVGLGNLVEGVPAVQQRPDILFGLTDLDAGQEAIEAETTQQVAGDQGNPCLFLRFEFDAGEVTGISAVQGETLTEYIVNNGNDQIPETGQQWGFEHEINLGQKRMNRPVTQEGSETDKSAP
ncbi:hypothetical protein D3C76_832640 [compost metagenome]